jgi:hypothetical protein
MTKDSEEHILQPGKYAVDFVPETKSIILLEGNRVMGEFPVIQIIKLKEKAIKPSVKIVLIKNNNIFIVYKTENIEVHAIIYTTDDTPD